MAGLFSNEEDVVSNIMQQRLKENQALGSPYGKYAGIVQAGGMFADVGADALVGGGYGSSDPRMQASKELKQITAVISQQFQGKTDSPDFYKALALAIQDKYPEKAQQAMDKAREIEQSIKKSELTDLQIEEAKDKSEYKKSLRASIKKKNPKLSEDDVRVVANTPDLLKSFFNPKYSS